MCFDLLFACMADWCLVHVCVCNAACTATTRLAGASIAQTLTLDGCSGPPGSGLSRPTCAPTLALRATIRLIGRCTSAHLSARTHACMHRLQPDTSVTAGHSRSASGANFPNKPNKSCQLTSPPPPPDQTRPGLVLPVRDGMVTCRHHQSLAPSWLVALTGGGGS